MLNRTLSSLPISVGTGLAIEALINTPLSAYSTLLINIRTLCRNAIESFDQEELYKEKDNVEIIFEAINEDVMKIAEALSTLKLNNHLNMIYYYPSYKGLSRMFPLARIKIPSTEKEMREDKLIVKVCDKLYSKYEKVITKNDVKIPDFNGKGIIITHHPVDLATSGTFTRLVLLESHTGTLKSFTMFYTKLTDGKNLTNIPLNKLTIQIFGDRAVNFYAMPLKIKNQIKLLAEAANWSTASTPSFVYSSVKGLNNSPDKDILLKMI